MLLYASLFGGPTDDRRQASCMPAIYAPTSWALVDTTAKMTLARSLQEGRCAPPRLLPRKLCADLLYSGPATMSSAHVKRFALPSACAHRSRATGVWTARSTPLHTSFCVLKIFSRDRAFGGNGLPRAVATAPRVGGPPKPSADDWVVAAMHTVAIRADACMAAEAIFSYFAGSFGARQTD